jgi:sugar lactone lactonase YvrE
MQRIDAGSTATTSDLPAIRFIRESWLRVFALILAASLPCSLGLCLACSGGANGGVLPGSTAMISSFQANPATIVPGQSTALTAVFAGGTGSISPGDLDVTSGSAINVSPMVSTTYTLTVTDPRGIPVSRTTSVTVLAPGIASFTATPTTITAGATAQLTGIFSNGTGLITPGNLAVVSGTPVMVTPGATTTYTLTVSGADGTTATLTATVTVMAPNADTLSLLAGVPGQPGTSDGTGSAAGFNHPIGVAMDPSGNAYVADSQNGTIRKITPAGLVSTLAGTAGISGSSNGTGPAASFSQPAGITVDKSGNVYVADQDNSLIRLVTPSGQVSTFAGAPGNSGSANGAGPAASFNRPAGVAVGPNGNLYVADTLNSTIRMITPDGLVSTLAGSAGTTGSVNGIGASASFYLPEGLAVDAAGNVYVADTGNSIIRKITSSGQVSTVAGTANLQGSTDGPAAGALFNNPAGVAVDSLGELYVADTGNSTIRKIDAMGIVSTVAGVVGIGGAVVPGPLPAKLSNPLGLALDPVTNGLLVTSDDAILIIQF